MNNLYNRYYKRHDWDILKYDKLCDVYKATEIITRNGRATYNRRIITVFCDLKWKRYLYELRGLKVRKSRGNYCKEKYSKWYTFGKNRGRWKYLYSKKCDGLEKYTYV